MSTKWQELLRRNQERLNRYINPDGTFNEELWKEDEDKDNKSYIFEQLKPEITEPEVERIYNELVKPSLLYHHPEDGKYMQNVISCYKYFKNYFKKE